MTHLTAFLHSTAAVATTLTAGMFTMLSLAGIALVGDHHQLTWQRDLLQVASDSAGVALMNEMESLSCTTMTDAQLNAALSPIARRYILSNLPAGKRDRADETLEVTLTPNCTAGTVGVHAKADLGGAVFGRWLWGNIAATSETRSGFEQLERLTEVALAIDVTGSMGRRRPGSTDPLDTLLAAVKGAALELVNILNASGDGSAAIGLIPWDEQVRLGPTERTRWENNGWAVYPTQRWYPKPYWTSGANWRRIYAPGEWQTIPATKPQAWKGCFEQRSTSGSNPPAFSAASPADTPFTMEFYNVPPNMSHFYGSFECVAPPKGQTWCYHGTPGTGVAKLSGDSIQYACQLPPPPIIPLTTDTDAIRTAINDLQAAGSDTYSAVGVTWAHRLLAPSWRSVWGGGTHPADPANGAVQKALVLLTDGTDSRHAGHRNRACTAAKNAGIKIFTIAAMPTVPARLQNSLTQCSSAAEDPDGTYVFVNNATPETLKDAFRSIGQQLKRFRRIY